MIYGESNAALLKYYVGNARNHQAVLVFIQKNCKRLAGVRQLIASLGKQAKEMYEYREYMMDFKNDLFNLGVPGAIHRELFIELGLVWM